MSLSRLVARAAVIAVLIFCLPGCDRSTENVSGIRFVDVARQAGVDRVFSTNGQKGLALTILETIGNGCAFFDADNDGNLDILLVDARLTFYQGDGRGHFTDATRAAGLDKLVGHFLGCAVGDYDNDGYADLYISGFRTGVLLRNEAGRAFRNVTKTAGLRPQPWGSSCGFADLDGDGRLDLFIANYVEFGPDPSKYKQRCEPLACGPQEYDPEKPTLYRNAGNGRFTDVSETSGVRTAAGKGLALAFADCDDDGDPDIIVANDQMPGDLFLNDGRGRFVNRGIASGTAFGPNGNPHGGMGADWADYDGDGRLDAIITTYENQPRSLYRNEGDGLFTDAEGTTGIGKMTAPFLAFGVKWLDYDNDGRPDLLLANGQVDNKIAVILPKSTYRQRTQLLRNLGVSGAEGARFGDVGDSVGDALKKPIVGRGLATGDFDNDGRIDALLIDDEGPVLLLHNTGGTAGNWIGLDLVGTGRSNRDAIGARVTVEAGKHTQIREVQTAGSYLSASDKRLHFGLGAATAVDRITIRWPDGQTETRTGLPAGKYHTIRQGSAGASLP